MALEKILKNGIENLKRNARKAVLYGMIAAGAAGAAGCEKIINPLAPQISTAQSQNNSGYVFDGDKLSVDIAAEQPSDVYARCMTPEGNWSPYQKLSDTDSDGKLEFDVNTSTYGNYSIQTKTVTAGKETENSPEDYPVFMNEADSDAALERVVKKIGISGMAHNQFYYDTGKDPTLIADNEIMGYYGPNFSDKGYEFDNIIEIKKSLPIRGPPGYDGLYYIDIKGSNTDVYDSAKKTSVNSSRDGYLFLNPVESDNDIEQQLSSEKSSGWPQIVP